MSDEKLFEERVKIEIALIEAATKLVVNGWRQDVPEYDMVGKQAQAFLLQAFTEAMEKK